MPGVYSRKSDRYRIAFYVRKDEEDRTGQDRALGIIGTGSLNRGN